MNCTRCKKKVGTKCDTCPDYLCIKCIKIHNKHQECFIEKQTNNCYLCGDKGGYDYGVKQFICGYCV